ncbi:hypothetical protein Gdia_2498 [Gluconacetobacter diazotrophicus PA1 5]|uniref:hypothetical protein n=1 Tax=Gluconacetobacter diazotrophicus TaxID=33996 RepID=UPI000173DAC9|nr:hypothetical protein [Gluconacetobacter diazotrophicus]ACI52242.1 hypothetical protein Gdia_2498 [Gluconacetobacter diazotrophicus PA1 5]TWB00404.1 hypothetical protein FBZ86_13718 [Gluconacetobacter diazotrophicus]
MTQNRTREEQIIALRKDINIRRSAYGETAEIHILEAEARATSELRAENERLQEALSPFANAASFFDADGNDFERDYEDGFTLGDPDEEDVRNSLTVGDLRKALAAISSTQTAWRTDRDRMNWLEKKERCSVERDVRGTVKVTAIASRRGVWSEDDTLRAAIDAAMDREERGDA